MASYDSYLNSISGKTFTSNYFYSPSITSESSSSVNGNATYSGTLTGFSQANLSGTVQSLNTTTGTFQLGGVTYQIHGSSSTSNALVFGTIPSSTDPFATSKVYVLSNSGAAPTNPISYSTANSYSPPSPTCFATGTRILTVNGEVAIEHLREGDLIVLEDDTFLPVQWIGRRYVECARSPWRSDVLPVRISSGAIGENMPKRDLLVSPGHSLAIEREWLIQAGQLVNGHSITQSEVAEITYWHVELERHAVIFAEGLAVESYIDMGNRGEFENGGEPLTLHPRFLAEALDQYCRPVVTDPVILSYYREKYAQRPALLDVLVAC